MTATLEILPTAGVDPSKPVTGDVTNVGGTSGVNAGDISKPAETPVAPSKPEVPAKFKNADGSINQDALLASYLELEKGKPVTKTPETPPVEVTKKLSAADLQAFSEEFTRDGKLSEKSYQTLNDKGITKEAADAYIAGQEARRTQYAGSLHEAVGGADKYSALIEWAGANLNEAEIKSANAAINSGDVSQARLVLDGLSARRTAAVGSSPNLVNGESVGGSPGIQPFRSNEEVVKAMSDPRYRTDDAYRQDVAKRLDVTKAFGR